MSQFEIISKEDLFKKYNSIIDKLSDVIIDLGKISSPYARKLSKFVAHQSYLLTREVNGLS